MNDLFWFYLAVLCAILFGALEITSIWVDGPRREASQPGRTRLWRMAILFFLLSLTMRS